MGDSDESVFWDDKEEDYAAFFTSHDYQINQTANQSINYDEDSGSKRIRLSPESDHQVLPLFHFLVEKRSHTDLHVSNTVFCLHVVICLF